MSGSKPVKSPYKTRSVLIVDDQEFVLKIVSTMLEKIGFGEIVSSRDGTEALEKFSQSKPDLIICDINMKPMDGLEFVTKLKSGDYKGADKTPIIFLTGEVSQSLMTRAADVGCDMFLLKPISPHNLTEKINQIFGSDTYKP